VVDTFIRAIDINELEWRLRLAEGLPAARSLLGLI
jgi:hypothetical protein